MAAEAVLNSEREPIEPTVVTTPLSGIDVMRGQNDALPEQAIIEHQHRPIEVFEFVVPKNMEDARARAECVLPQPEIVGQDSKGFCAQWSIFALITPQIKKSDERRFVEQWRIQFIAPDEIDHNTLRGQS